MIKTLQLRMSSMEREEEKKFLFGFVLKKDGRVKKCEFFLEEGSDAVESKLTNLKIKNLQMFNINPYCQLPTGEIAFIA